MEVIGETPPPLPPKTRKPLEPLPGQEDGPKAKASNGFFLSGHSKAARNGFDVDSFKTVNKSRCDEDVSSPPQAPHRPQTQAGATQSDGAPAAGGLSPVSEFSEYKDETFGPRIITWAGCRERADRRESEEVYENVSCGAAQTSAKEVSRDTTVRNGQSGKVEKTPGKKKTPKIEVRQEDNKTVVKISIKEMPTPEEEISEENRFKAFEDKAYENGFQTARGFASHVVYSNVDVNGGEYDGLVYENANVLVEHENFYENLSIGCYENVEEGSYANVSEAPAAVEGPASRGPKKGFLTEANYGNLNGKESECDQVYENREFEVFKNSVVSIMGKNLTPPAEKSPDRKDDESLESIESDCRIYVNEDLSCKTAGGKFDETAESLESRKKGKTESERNSSVVELVAQKPTSAAKAEPEFGDMSRLDDHSSGDPFDSGTCSDVDSLPTFVQSKKGNVIVTIKSLQGEEKAEDPKKNEPGHRRAESLTSSGVGVDSEESDDEKSNISCDSLNSNEPYARSNCEDHGYHTPNSEDKTGSPIEQMDYENVMKGSSPEPKGKLEAEFPQEEFYENSDIIQQVADASQKTKNLRTENSGVYLAKRIDPSEFDEYENVHVFESAPRVFKKKRAPPPPPSKPSFAALRRFSEGLLAGDDDSKKSLPVGLLRDIQSRNVRLSSAYPNGEKPEMTEKSSADPVPGRKVNFPGKVTSTIKKLNKLAEDESKQLMVEERTYEERKCDVRSVKVKKICAMEVDTDKFYKFHLAENVRESGENGNEEETFAGIKDYLSREKPAAITSAKGTIRGVKNRVKAGIATFLQLHENKSHKDKDAGKVVVYTTTMGIVRETYHKCLKVKQILRTLMVKFEERDVFMSLEAQEEIRDRMKCDVISVPQVFVEGQHVGDAETIERLNEMGELRTILKPYKSADACSTCKVCGGYRLLPCRVCKGSKKSIHRNHFTAEFVALKCMNCDQVGLTKCYAC